MGNFQSKQREQFWTKRLSGEFAELQVPGKGNPRGGSAQVELGDELAAALVKACGGDDKNLFCFVQACFAIALWHWTEAKDFCLFSPPVAHVSLPKSQNPLVHPIHLDPQQSFRDLFLQLRAQFLAALPFQDYDAGKLLEQLEAKEKALPSMQIGMAFDRLTDPEFRLDVDLQLALSFASENPALELLDPKGILEAPILQDLLSALPHLLQAALSKADAPIHELEALSTASKELLLNQLAISGTSVEPPEASIHTWFSKMARQRGDAVALQLEAQSMSYRELDRLSSQLAGRLVAEMQVQPGQFVALLGRPGIPLLVGMLAILKAGAAYVPLDPDYPAERTDWILKDSGVQILLCCDKGDVPDSFTGKTVDIESAWDYPEACCLLTDPEFPAYIIYTSGTTGKPKGCLVRHRNLTALISGTKSLFDFRTNDVWLLFHSFCFDFSVWEIFGALLNGAVLVVPGRETVKDGRKVLDLMRRFGVTVLNQTPASFYALTALEGLEKNRQVGESLRHVIFGGERLNFARLKEWTERYPLEEVALVNMYGITETTVHVTWHIVTEEDLKGEKGSVVGKALPGYEAYVLDEQGKLLPRGRAGELVVGGTGVSQGYLHKPELTDERFVPHPFGGEGKLYRSGDLCRWNAEGNLEYLGRIDRQIKVRGYRIEPGEIERTLLGHPAVSGVAVTGKVGADGLTQLLCFYEASEAVVEKELLELLVAHLPNYMVPGFMQEVERIPLTANGKVDFKKLPEIGGPDGHASTKDQALLPMAKLWSEVLGREIPPDPDQNFFQLGGHSLNAMRLVAAVNAAFQVQLEIRDVFVHARLGAFAERIANLEPRHRKRIPKAEERAHYPLSPAQLRMYILEALSQGSGAYHLSFSLIHHAPLDPAKLSQALDSLLQRHEILRTAFVEHAEGPVQRILPAEQIPSPLTWQPRGGSLGKPAIQTFDLSQPPLFRLHVQETAGGEWRLDLDMHHIIGDGWSLELFAEELLENYAESPEREPLRLQYRDFALWQQESLERGDLAKSREWWMNQLAGPLPDWDFPFDHPRPAERSFKGKMLSIPFPTGMAERLRELGTASETSTFQYLLTALKAFLFRYANMRDQIIGIPVSGRSVDDLEDQLGLYLNTLAIRSQLNPEESFSAALNRIRETTLKALSHQDYPFERLIEDLGLHRSTQDNPLFNVMLVFQEESFRGVDLWSGKKVEIEAGEVSTAKFDLTFHLNERDGELQGGIEYNLDVFDEGRIREMGKQFVRLLESSLEQPERALQDLPLMDEDAREKMEKWGRGAERKGEMESVLEGFDIAAQNNGNENSLFFENEYFIYSSLNEKSKGAARKILAYFGEKQEVVALYGERSPELLIGLLATLKAGAIALPLRKDDPRQTHILRESGCKLILNLSSEDFIPQDPSIQVLRLTDLPEATPDLELPKINGESIAYLLYTSGSTGLPKGCIIRHRNLARYIEWACDYYFSDPQSGDFGWMSPLSFDFTWTVIFCTLLRGRILHIFPESLGPEEILRKAFHPDSGVDSLKLTPSHIRLLKEMDLGEAELKLVISGGEALLPSDVALLQQHCPEIRLVNEYGPTETTIGCVVKEIAHPEQAHLIGRPIWNCRVKVLDAQGKIAATGVQGELWVAGEGVGAGYWGNEKETEKRFKKGWYRTGDLVEWTSEGELRFRGRMDRQVKIRGHRVEPGEIEMALGRISGVEAAAVKVMEMGETGLQIVAYVQGERHDEAELRAALSQDLPDFMLPAFYVRLEELPLSPNGKTDYAALAPPSKAQQEGRPPITAHELWLAEQWRKILDLKSPSIESNFFQSGGHSLSGMRLIGSIRREIGIQLSLRDLFRFPTLGDLAARMDKADRQAGEQIPQAPESEKHPLSAAQRRLFILDRLASGSSPYNIAAAAVLPHAISPAHFRTAIQALVQRHESLRTIFELDGEELAQIILPAGQLLPELKFESLGSREWEPKAQEICRTIARASFSLTQGPLFRIHILQSGPDRSLVALAMHHIIGDGWSMEILIDELVQLYAAAEKAEPHALTPLRIQYKDFARWQNREMEAGKGAAAQAYWHDRLRGKLPLLELHPDFPRQTDRKFAGGICTFDFPPSFARRIKNWAQKRGLTSFMTTLAAFQILLHRLSHQPDLLIGSPLAGRNAPELHGQIGCYLNTVVLRSRMEPEQALNGFLAQVRETVLGAMENQNYPFDSLVEELQQGRDTSRSALFDVMIVFQEGSFQGKEAERGWKEFEVETGASKFDLVLHLAEEQGELKGALEYDSGLFEARRIGLMAAQYQLLLEQLLSESILRVDELKLLPEAEREMVAAFSEAHPKYPGLKVLDEDGTLLPIGIPGELHWDGEEKIAGKGRWNVRGELEFWEEGDGEKDAETKKIGELGLQLAGIWREILGREFALETKADFFELGGHSLSAMRLLAAIEQRFRVRLELRDLFHKSTLSDMAECISQLEQVGQIAIAKVPDAARYVLSPAQKRMFILEALSEGTDAYAIGLKLRYQGRLSKAKLQDALEKLLQRHEILRTAFVDGPQGPVQVVHALAGLAVDIVWHQGDLALEASRRASFDLAAPPLLRLSVTENSPQDFHIHLLLHHIIADGWSLEFMASELMALYRGRDLPPLRLQYRDFAAWLAAGLDAPEMQSQGEWWREHLKGPLPNLSLPADRPRPKRRSFQGGLVDWKLDEETTRSLKTLAKRHGATLFMLFSAAVKAFLYRYTGETDQIVGVPVAGRPHPELESQIGLYLNTLALRSTVPGRLSFSEFLQRERDLILEGLSRQAYPFDRLVEELDLPRELGQNPIFEVMLVYREAAFYVADLWEDGQEEANLLSETDETSKFDLTFHVQHAENRIGGGIEYNADLFEHGRMERLHLHFLRFIQSLTADPEIAIDRLNLIGEEEKGQLGKWGMGEKRENEYRTVLDWFAEIAASKGQETALFDGRSSLGYAELDGQSDRVAAGLVQAGMQSGDRIALLGDRSIELLICLLGILKAGGVALPLRKGDPRNGAVLLESGASFSLSPKDHEPFPNVPSLSFQDLVETAPIPLPAPDPNQTAYLLYTSGSTGRPKGVVIRHRNLLNYIAWACEHYFDRPDQGDFGWFSPLSFDFTWTVILCPLLRGRRLRVYPESMDMEAILKDAFSKESGVDAVKVTPSHLRILQAMSISEASMDLVICGGEELLPEDVRSLQGICPQARLFNEYGPTEATVGCLCKEVREASDAASIGRPIFNTRIKVLDENGLPCPIGRPGELFVGGAGVAAGYWENAAESEKRFSEDWYRTGDRVEWTEWGELLFKGRLDRQLKVRGHRIEPGEIEQRILEMEEVEQVVVTVVDQRLVAYYGGSKMPANSLASHLSKELPAYMLPSIWMHVTEFPLTANGKVDQKRLPKSEGDELGAKPLETPGQLWMAPFWEQALGISAVGPDTDFFAAGGHSLLAMRLLSLLRQRSGKAPSLRALFENSSLRNFSAHFEGLPSTSDAAIPKADPADHYPLSPGQLRIWLLHQMEGNSIAYNMRGQRLVPTNVSKEALVQAMQALVERHEAFRTRFGMENGEAVQWILKSADFELEMIEVADREGMEKALFEIGETDFQLGEGPLFRVALISSSQESRLTWVMHHIISDGVSMEILAKEIAILLEDPMSPLPELPVTVKDHALWMQGELKGEAFATHREFWHGQMAAPLPSMLFQRDFSPQTQEANQGVAFIHHLDSATLIGLRKVARDQGVSLYILLLASLKVVLARSLGQPDIIVGTPVSGRNRHELQNLVGFFLNTVLIRSEVDPHLSFSEFLKTVKENTLSAFEHQDYPFEQLVSELALPRDVNSFPITPIFLNLLNHQDLDGQRLSDFSSTHLAHGHQLKFDLNWYVSEFENGLQIHCDYKSGLFRKESIALLNQLWRGVLQEIVEGGERPMEMENSKWKPETWRGKKELGGTSLVTAFQAQVERRPDALALWAEDVKMSYGELQRRAESVARAILASHPEEARIGLVADQGWKMVVAVWGILHAGKAYVPLDRSTPPARLEAIRRETGLRVILATVEFEMEDVELIAFDALLKQDRPDISLPSPEPQQSAYVLHTSGSTGRPKAFSQSHAAVLHYISAYSGFMDLGEQDRISGMSPMVYDSFVNDFFGAHLNGAAYCLFSLQGHPDPQSWCKWAAESGLTLWHSVPDVFLRFSNTSMEAGFSFPALRLVKMTGAPSSHRHLAAFQKLDAPNARFVVSYGLTESTLVSIAAYGREVTGRLKILPAGMAIEGTEVAILNADGREMGRLEPGEIAISTLHMAIPEGGQRGERYFERGGKRWFRTGDRGRFNAEGALEVMGRMDRQLKLRGVRIAPEEIEMALESHGAVAQAAVGLYSPAEKAQVLMAAVRLKAEVSAEALKEYLVHRLPAFMVPSGIRLVEELPKLPSGKVDHVGLEKVFAHAPIVERAEEEEKYGSELEESLAEIWMELLEDDEMPEPEENFFDLGGDSLKAVQLIARIKKRWNVEVDPQSLLYRNLRQLAAAIEEG